MSQPERRYLLHEDPILNNEDRGDVQGKKSRTAECPSPANLRLGQLLDSVPQELLTEIFFWCCPTYNDRHRTPPYSVLTLSHVCQLWRDAASQTPSLWTYVKLTVSNCVTDCLDKPSELLKLWLSRAQNCPLVVDVEFIENPRLLMPANVVHHVKSLIETALANKPSIRSSDMQLSAAIDATAPKYSPNDRYPRISEQYSWAEPTARPDRPHPGSVQMHVTRHANIVYALEGHASLAPHLVHLDLRDAHGAMWFPVDECHVVLAGFPALEQCALRVGPAAVGDAPLEPVAPAHLRTLALAWGADGAAAAGALLDVLAAPALGQLELAGPLPAQRRWGHLQAFLRRGAPQLWALDLGGMDCARADLLGCLAQCAGLEHLALDGCVVGAELVRAAGGGRRECENARRALMRLEFVSLLSCDVFNLENLLRAVRADVLPWCEAQLETLYVFDCRDIAEGDAVAVRGLHLEWIEGRLQRIEEVS